MSDQIAYTVPPPFFTQGGDSGAPVFELNSRDFLGMLNSEVIVFDANGNIKEIVAFGTNAATIQARLGFDAWYGTQTVQDQTIGVFNPSTAQWKIDNGNGRMDSCNALPSCSHSGQLSTCFDGCFQYGTPGNVNIPLTGDWDASRLAQLWLSAGSGQLDRDWGQQARRVSAQHGVVVCSERRTVPHQLCD